MPRQFTYNEGYDRYSDYDYDRFSEDNFYDDYLDDWRGDFYEPPDACYHPVGC